VTPYDFANTYQSFGGNFHYSILKKDSRFLRNIDYYFIYYFLWLYSPARAVATSFHEVS
jgi:hypothetical protein